MKRKEDTVEKTIAAISTGGAPGGIGVIRISGSGAVAVADGVFSAFDGTPLSKLKGYRAKYGSITADGERIDNAVALVFRAPKSYTGEDVVELSVHGGLLLVQKTLDAVFKAGAEPAEAGEFTKRAFLNGKIDLTQAESVAELISAQGEQGLKASYSALQGALSRKINGVLEQLTDASALMAAWVDYPDEEIPELSDEALGKTLKVCKAELSELLDGYDNGQIATKGVVTAIAGRPNVGKSSLMNMLSRKDKSIVTHIAGTTRDVVEADVTLGGVVLHLLDTAGLRESEDYVEKIGVEKAKKAIDEAQLVLAVFDAAEEINGEDRELMSVCRGKKAIAVINKTDGPLRLTTDEAVRGNFDTVVYTSAVTGAGEEYLVAAVKETLGVSNFDGSAPLLANLRQKKNCENALETVNEALSALEAGMTFDAINVMLDAAIDELLSLTGRKATEEVVNNIFKNLCVGK